MSKDKDAASVKSFLREYEAAIGAGDISRIASMFAQDAVVMPQDGSVLTGREAIKSWYQNALAGSKAKQTTSVDEIEVTGDSAFVRGSFTLSFAAKGGGHPNEVNGTSMAIYKRQVDGPWEASRVMWTTYKPFPAPGN